MSEPATSDLYARKSRKDAGVSARRQESDWRADCAREGITPGRVFVDPDLSASRYATKSRPDFAQLLVHLRSGACRMISLWEASRGSRQLHEWVQLIDLCRDRSTLIRIFGEEGVTYDPRKRRDYRTLASEGLDAHDESERLSERVRAGKRDAAARGRPSGPVPYGYRRLYEPGEGGKMRIAQVENEEQAAIVRRLVKDTLDGEPLMTQARRLTAEGVPSPSGDGLWRNVQIRRILCNPRYQGDTVHHGQIVARDGWPKLISRDEHRQLRALLDAPGRLTNHGNTALLYQLSGAAICGAPGCGRALRPWRRGTQYSCRTAGCRGTTAPMALMDQAVDAMVIARLRLPDTASLFSPAADDDRAAESRRELDEAQQRLEGFYAEAATGGLSARALAAVEAKMLPRIAGLERRLREASTPPSLLALADVDVPGTWHDLPVGVRREVIKALAVVVLSPSGRGLRWTPWRLRESRWHGDELTWGQRWERDGIPRPVNG